MTFIAPLELFKFTKICFNPPVTTLKNIYEIEWHHAVFSQYMYYKTNMASIYRKMSDDLRNF